MIGEDQSEYFRLAFDLNFKVFQGASPQYLVKASEFQIENNAINKKTQSSFYKK